MRRHPDCVDHKLHETEDQELTPEARQEEETGESDRTDGRFPQRFVAETVVSAAEKACGRSRIKREGPHPLVAPPELAAEPTRGHRPPVVGKDAHGPGEVNGFYILDFGLGTESKIQNLKSKIVPRSG